MLKIGCIGFGGGSALISVLHEECVERRGYVNEDDFNRDVLMASITPGALPVEIAGGIGHRLFGWKGTLAGAYGMALPGFLMTVICLALFSFLSDGVLNNLAYISMGICAFICAVLTEYVLSSVKKTLSESGKCKWLPIVIMAAVFVLSQIGLKTIYIFLIAIAVSFVADLVRSSGIIPKTMDRTRITDIVAVAVPMLAMLCVCAMLSDSVFRFFGFGAMSSLMSFGGGDAYLTVADGAFVSTGLVPAQVFYEKIVPLVNAFPGSILCKTMSAVGFETATGMPGAFALALLGFTISVAMSCGVFSLVHVFYGEWRIGQYMRPIICGMMLTVAITLFSHSQCLWISLIAYVISLLMFRFRIPSALILLSSAALAWLLCVWQF